jgi:hypothetical protein
MNIGHSSKPTRLVIELGLLAQEQAFPWVTFAAFGKYDLQIYRQSGNPQKPGMILSGFEPGQDRNRVCW